MLAIPNSAFIKIPKCAGCSGSYRTREGIGRKPKSFVDPTLPLSAFAAAFSSTFGSTTGAGRVSAVELDWQEVRSLTAHNVPAGPVSSKTFVKNCVRGNSLYSR